VPADVLLSPIFIGDRLGETESLSLLGPSFNFETRADAKIRFQTKTTRITQPTAILTRARAMPATSIYSLRTMPSADYASR
jgi:hypothetical protein